MGVIGIPEDLPTFYILSDLIGGQAALGELVEGGVVDHADRAPHVAAHELVDGSFLSDHLVSVDVRILLLGVVDILSGDRSQLGVPKPGGDVLIVDRRGAGVIVLVLEGDDQIVGHETLDGVVRRADQIVVDLSRAELVDHVLVGQKCIVDEVDLDSLISHVVDEPVVDTGDGAVVAVALGLGLTHGRQDVDIPVVDLESPLDRVGSFDAGLDGCVGPVGQIHERG